MNWRSGIFAAAVAGLALAFLYGRMLERTAPQLTGAELVSTSAVPSRGGKLVIRYTTINASVCPIDVEVSIMSAVSGAVVWRHRGVSTNLSPEWIAEVNVPPLSAGPYSYNTTFKAKCSDSRIYSSSAPAVRFEVR